MKNLSLGLLVAVTTTVMSGCALYFGNDDHDDPTWTYCGSDGYYTCEDENCQWVSATCPDQGTGSGSSGGGFECSDNSDCAAGCYCADGVCEEAGFCTQDSDCGNGYECNEDRSSCEPTSCTCFNDSGAVSQGYDYCDELTGTCKNGDDPAGTCGGDAAPTCGTLPPACAPGDVPLLGADGCWNGQCQGASDCATPASCKWLNTAATCDARTDCAQVVNGINCKKPDGTACQAGDANCTCDSYTFASCRDAATP